MEAVEKCACPVCANQRPKNELFCFDCRRIHKKFSEMYNTQISPLLVGLLKNDRIIYQLADVATYLNISPNTARQLCKGRGIVLPTRTDSIDSSTVYEIRQQDLVLLVRDVEHQRKAVPPTKQANDTGEWWSSTQAQAATGLSDGMLRSYAKYLVTQKDGVRWNYQKASVRAFAAAVLKGVIKVSPEAKKVIKVPTDD